MPINDEIIVRRVVVNAHARFRDSRVGKLRDEFAEEISAPADELFFDRSFKRAHLDLLAFVVIGYLHRARVMNGKPIKPALELDKNGKAPDVKIARRARGRLEVRDFLASGT